METNFHDKNLCVTSLSWWGSKQLGNWPIAFLMRHWFADFTFHNKPETCSWSHLRKHDLYNSLVDIAHDCGVCFTRFYNQTYACSKAFPFRRPVILLWGKQKIKFRQGKQRRFRASKELARRDSGGWADSWMSSFVAHDMCILPCLIVGTFSNHDGNSNENVAWNLISSCYFNYCAIIPIRSTCTMRPNYPVTEKVKTAFKLRQRMKILFAYVLHKNLEFGHFTSLFGRGRWRNVQKIIKHVQGLCFSLKCYCFLALSLPSP